MKQFQLSEKNKGEVRADYSAQNTNQMEVRESAARRDKETWNLVENFSFISRNGFQFCQAEGMTRRPGADGTPDTDTGGEFRNNQCYSIKFEKYKRTKSIVIITELRTR